MPMATSRPWGRWFRHIDVEVSGSQVLMSGASERPLLVLERIGEGRVAQLLSDHAWLWARGFEDGGPQGLLLRQLVHWLMQEPELEEEALRAKPEDEAIAIERRSLEETARRVTITAPSGATPGDQRWSLARTAWPKAVVQADEPGLYEVSDGELITHVAVRPIDPEELADMRATPDRFGGPWSRRATARSNGWRKRGRRPCARLRRGRATSGRDWIGLVRQRALSGHRRLAAAAPARPARPAAAPRHAWLCLVSRRPLSDACR